MTGTDAPPTITDAVIELELLRTALEQLREVSKQPARSTTAEPAFGQVCTDRACPVHSQLPDQASLAAAEEMIAHALRTAAKRGREGRRRRELTDACVAILSLLQEARPGSGVCPQAHGAENTEPRV